MSVAEVAMPLSMRCVCFGLLCSGVLNGAYGQVSGSPAAHPHTTQNAGVRAAIAHDNRAIAILAIGLKEGWSSEEYAAAFHSKMSHGPNVLVAGCSLEVQLLSQPRAIWDEQPPASVEAMQAMEECRQHRNLLVSIEKARQIAGSTVQTK